MSIDLYAKAMNLLQRVANSVHDREPKSPNLLCFSSNEVKVVEGWLQDFLTDIRINKPTRDT